MTVEEIQTAFGELADALGDWEGDVMANFHSRMMNIQGNPASMIAGSVQSWNEGHKYARHKAAEIALEADHQIAALEARIAKADALAEAAWLFMESHCVDQDSGEMADRERLENAATAYREGSDT